MYDVQNNLSRNLPELYYTECSFFYFLALVMAKVQFTSTAQCQSPTAKTSSLPSTSFMRLVNTFVELSFWFYIFGRAHEFE